MITTQRTLSGFPHCGRTFLCDDVYGIVDAWKANDAYIYAMSNGLTFANESASCYNAGNMWSIGNQSGHIATVPVCGIDGGYIQGNTTIPMGALVGVPHLTWAVGEIHPECRGTALNMTFRMLNEYEYSRTGPYLDDTGVGWQSQRITITLSNIASINGAHVLVDIFANFGWYNANVAVVPFTPNVTIDLSASPYGMRVGEIVNLVLMGQIPANKMTGQICQAACTLSYEFLRDPTGGNWSTAYLNDGVRWGSFRFDHLVNPQTQKSMGGCGIINFALHTYNDGIPFAGSGTLGPTGGRRQSISTPSQSLAPTMGTTTSASMFAYLKTTALAAFRAPWHSFSMIGRRFNGVRKPICGNGGLHNDTALEYHESYIQVPHGITHFVLIAQLQTVATGGTQTVEITLTNFTGTVAQTLLVTTSATSTSERYVYVNALLTSPPPATGVNGGKVQPYLIRLESRKSAPRAPVVPYIVEPNLSDGLKSVYIAFYKQ
jgi:hypothetical protein